MPSLSAHSLKRKDNYFFSVVAQVFQPKTAYRPQKLINDVIIIAAAIIPKIIANIFERKPVNIKIAITAAINNLIILSVDPTFFFIF